MQDSWTSADGHRYRVQRHEPDGDPPAGGHPLIWLLDAPTTWAPMQQALAATGLPALVVGIDWDHPGGVERRRRFRDFTRAPRVPDTDPDAGEAGGAGAFLDFLLGTLRPALLPTLAADPRRQTLLGHSLSGLFVLDALLRRPGAFDRHVALSPSLWWDEARLLDAVESADAAALAQARVFLRVGQGEQAAGPEKPAEIDGEPALLGERHMVANAQRFADALQAQGAHCDHDVVPDAGHHAVLPATMADALRFACAQ